MYNMNRSISMEIYAQYTYQVRCSPYKYEYVHMLINLFRDSQYEYSTSKSRLYMYVLCRALMNTWAL